MQKYQNNVISPTGLALANVSVLVQNYPIGTTATIFSDNGTTVAPNPLTTDANGAFAFYADDGHYSLVISGPSVQTLTLTDIVLADEIPGDNIAATTVHLTDIITVQQGTDLRAATIDQVRSAILSGGTALAVTQGGTGQVTLTANELLLGDGTNPVRQIAPGTVGQVLLSGGAGADPAFGAIPSQSGRLIGVQVFASSGTYTPTTGTNSIIVEGVGGGGGSGGSAATGAGVSAVGPVASAGAYAKARFTAGFSAATVTIGAAGAAGAAGATTGGAGGTTSFGSLVSCPGGTAGVTAGSAAAGAVNPMNPSVAPTISGAAQILVSMAGQSGTPGFLTSGATPISGNGGGNPIGTGGNGSPYFGQAGSAFPGVTGTGFGAGASGISAAQNQPALPGATGTRGVVIVYEYS